LLLAALVASGASAASAQPPDPQSAAPRPPDPAREATPVPNPWTFSSDAGLMLFFVRPDKTVDFETVLARVKDALLTSESPDRRALAAGWRVFKAREIGPGASVIYVSVINPAVKDADYSIGTVISEASPSLYTKYLEVFGTPAVNLFHLTAVVDFSR